MWYSHTQLVKHLTFYHRITPHLKAMQLNPETGTKIFLFFFPKVSTKAGSNSYKSRYIKGCRPHWSHLPSFGQVGYPQGEPVGMMGHQTGTHVVRPQSSSHQIFPYACSLLMGGREWEMGALVVDVECHIRCLRDPWRSALSCPMSPLPPSLSRIYLLFPSFTSTPSTCGNCPFTLGSGCIFNFFIWFTLALLLMILQLLRYT